MCLGCLAVKQTCGGEMTGDQLPKSVSQHSVGRTEGSAVLIEIRNAICLCQGKPIEYSTDMSVILPLGADGSLAWKLKD
jgi:hypothetical protein